MQITNARFLILITVLLVGAGVYAVIVQPVGAGTPRWPTDDSVYAAAGWTIGLIKVEHINTADFISRAYRAEDGTVATLTIETHQSPKLYAAGPEVPFLGSGFTVTSPPTGAVAVNSDAIGSLTAQQGPGDTLLVMYAYGERRGLLGNGAVGWSFAIADGLLGKPNDYYKLYLSTQTNSVNPALGADLSALAHTVFPNIASWYGA